MNKARVLFIAPANTVFCEKDRQILEKHFKVRAVYYSWNNMKSMLALLPKAILGTLWCDLTFSWFGSFHAFFAVLFSTIFGKKAIVVAGGYDVVKMPERSYGLLNNILWRYFAVFTFRFCDKILAVSRYSQKEAAENLKLNPGKIEVVYHGFDASSFSPQGKKENIVLTVAGVNPTTFMIKGLKTFIEASGLVPGAKFVLIGKTDNKFLRRQGLDTGGQTELAGYLPQDELLSYLQKTKVYVQVSYRESFGCALAEAMLCECIPVVTNSAAIPEVVGDTGCYVDYGDIEGTAAAIREAMNDRSDRAKKARERIKERFPLEERERRLIAAIEGLLNT